MLTCGLVFPATMASVDDSIAPGRWLGWLLAANGIGGLLGAEIAYRGLMPWFGIHVGIGVVAVFYAAAAIVLSVLLFNAKKLLLLPGSAAVGIALFWTIGPLRELPQINPHLGFKLLDEQTGREGVVAVVESDRIGRAIIMSNQYVLGGTNAHHDQARQAHLPLLFHPMPRDVAFIGVATGITPGAALEHAAVESVTAVELSPLVVRAAERFFAEENRGVVVNEKTQVVVEDGRTYLAASQDCFDVVVGDLFLPWGPGEARLYSREHFRSVRESLREGGIFCQWLAMYQLTPEQFDVLAATFQSVFGEVHAFRNSFDNAQPSLALVASRGGKLDWSQLAKRCREERVYGKLLDPSMRHAEGVKMLYLGTLPVEDPSEARNTLGNMRLELSAGRERLTGNPGQKYLYGARWLRFVGERWFPEGDLSHSIPLPRLGQTLAE